jgi:hypothetical protein
MTSSVSTAEQPIASTTVSQVSTMSQILSQLQAQAIEQPGLNEDTQYFDAEDGEDSRLATQVQFSQIEIDDDSVFNRAFSQLEVTQGEDELIND